MVVVAISDTVSAGKTTGLFGWIRLVDGGGSTSSERPELLMI